MGGGDVAGLDSLFGRWYDLVLLAVALGLIGWYFAAYARAMRPRSGTLEWIGMYDRPKFSLSGQRYGVERGDVLPMLALCLFSGALWGFAASRAFQDAYQGGAVPGDLVLSASVRYVLLPAVTAAGAYFLFRNMFGSTAATVFGCVILAMDLGGSSVAQSVVVLASVFLWRFMTADYDGSFGASCPDLVLTAAVLAAGCYFEPACVFFAAAALLLIVITGFCRFRSGFSGYTAGSVLVFLAALAAATALVFLPAAIIGGMDFPRLLVSETFYRLIWQRIRSNAFGLPAARETLSALLALRYSWLLLFSGLLAALASLIAVFRRSRPQGLLLAAGFAATVAMWLLGGSFALPVFCTAALCFVWSELRRRGRGMLAAAGAACLILTLLVFYVLSWII